MPFLIDVTGKELTYCKRELEGPIAGELAGQESNWQGESRRVAGRSREPVAG